MQKENTNLFNLVYDKPEIPPTRINELMSMMQFLDNAKVQPNTHEYTYLMEEWDNQGMPHIKEFSPEVPSIYQYKNGGDRPYFTTAGWYGGDSVFPAQPDTVHVNPGNVNDLFAEFGHTDQWNAPTEIRNLMFEKNIADWNKYGQDRDTYDANAYYNKEDLEYDAHSVREPRYHSAYWDALKNDEYLNLFNLMDENRMLIQ